MTCPNCGLANSDNAKFCANCGTALGGPSSSSSSGPYQQNPPHYQAPDAYAAGGPYQQAPPAGMSGGRNSLGKNIGIGCLIAVLIVLFFGLSCTRACFGLRHRSYIHRRY